MATHQLFIRLLDGKTVIQTFTSPVISCESIKDRLYEITKIPTHYQRLVSQGRQLNEGTLISSDKSGHFPTVHLLLRLLGGKGGFGSLLRGAATKAGQKKTNNFDACRDMSGRRLRHVNAEKKLEEWRAEAEERELEKIADEFIKKKAKASKGSGSGKSEEKYIEKYREDSAKCIEEVEASVRESIGLIVNSKRKRLAAAGGGQDSKRLKIWMGKKQMGDSDSEGEDDDEGTKERSIVLDNGNGSDPNEEGEGSSGASVSGKLTGESTSGGSSESGSEEEKEIILQENLGSADSPCVGGPSGDGSSLLYSESEIHEESMYKSGTEAVLIEKHDCSETEFGNMEEVIAQTSTDARDFEAGAHTSEPVKEENEATMTTKAADLEKPLNFDEYNSAAEMEVLGMEMLKSELQTRGLKCGGTLQERAARLFLLKTTPLEKLPKKLFAKK